MKTYLVVMASGAIASVGIIAGLGACASDDTTTVADPPDVLDVLPSDAGPDAEPDGDAGEAPCSDCEYFPADCSDGSLCPSGPFDQSDPSAGLDWRSRVNTIRGRSSTDVWVAGALGALAHFDGTAWRRSDPGSSDSMHALWLRGSAEILLATMDLIHTRDLAIGDAGVDAGAPSPDGWTTRPAYISSGSYYRSYALTSAWAADGAEWLWATTATTSTSSSPGIWRMHFVESTQRFEFVAAVSSSACKSLGCSSLTSVHGTSANDVWAVGAFGAAIHIADADGSSPVFKAYNTQTTNMLNGVWAAAPNDVWAVGVGGEIRHYTGDPTAWDIVTNIPTTESLNAIWGASPSDIWAVGDKGVALHYDGSGWTRIKVAGLDGARRPDLTAVWMPSPGHVWIGGVGIVLSLGGKP
jgi:hypothetical protein